MLRLIVMRHAKSSWKNNEEDHARPLNDRGRRDAPRVAAALAQMDWTPDLILSSDAQRTHETYDGMCVSFPSEVSVNFLNQFYLAGIDALRDEVPAVPDDVGCLMVLGHNPGWEHIVHWLSDEHCEMKTATAALLTRDIPNWHDAIQPATWNLETVIYPREL